jgi:hypothetical protein
VTRDSRSAGDATASEHADVSGSGEQEDGCPEEAHGSGGILVGVVEGPDAERDGGGGSAGADKKCGEVKPAYAPTAAGKPRRGDHVEGDDAADDVAMLRLHDGETEGAGGQGKHRNGEDISGGAMQAAAFADGNSECAGQQADGAGENVKNQERKPHASTPFQDWPLQHREVAASQVRKQRLHLRLEKAVSFHTPLQLCSTPRNVFPV